MRPSKYQIKKSDQFRTKRSISYKLHSSTVAGHGKHWTMDLILKARGAASRHKQLHSHLEGMPRMGTPRAP